MRGVAAVNTGGAETGEATAGQAAHGAQEQGVVAGGTERSRARGERVAHLEQQGLRLFLASLTPLLARHLVTSVLGMSSLQV